ncbi:MAG: adenylate/guanylate cyclase domain-containing protein [Armatimonadetes bacterium]|nr:adenylate/guanylate cyclase domain-containing protein [Armatimonadota bacterium]
MDVAPGHAQGAINGCLAAIRAVTRFNEAERLPQNLSPWRVGMSLHSGMVLGGNIGVASRTKFTFIGDVVNTAAHMEKFNKEFGTQIVISDATRSRLIETPPLLPDTGFLPGRPTLPVWGVAESSTKKEGNG